MPTEIRRLIFTADELAEALAQHRKVANGKLPEGRIVFCRATEGSDFKVTVKVLPNGRDEVQTIHLESEYVGGALVAFCLEHRIPLPRGAEKSLQVMGNNVALNLTLNAGVKSLPTFVRTTGA